MQKTRKPSYDVESTLTSTEVSRAITALKLEGKNMKYRELVGFSPADAARTDSAKKYGLTSQDIAIAAGREEVVGMEA